MLGLLVISSFVVIARRMGVDELEVDTLPASVLGVALSILLGFKINSAYTRWWDARKLLGSITNDCRNFARQLFTFCAGEEVVVNRMIRRQIGYSYALKNSLRKQAGSEELALFLSPQELDQLTAQRNQASAILQMQAQDLTYLYDKETINSVQQVQLDSTLCRLADSQGGCERIKNTGFPNSFTFHLNLFILIYSYLLPFIFIKNSDWHTIPAAVFIGYVFLSLSTIAQNIEDPFENTWYDIPMNAICRTIEVNLSQQLGEKNPEPFLQPVDGFLH